MVRICRGTPLRHTLARYQLATQASLLIMRNIYVSITSSDHTLSLQSALVRESEWQKDVTSSKIIGQIKELQKLVSCNYQNAMIVNVMIILITGMALAYIFWREITLTGS